MGLTVLEIWSYLQIPVYWYLFKRFAKRDITGELVAGTLIGVFIEFATQPLWDYHFKITVYKDVPLSVVTGWGVMLALVCFLSEKLYRRFFSPRFLNPKDPRILICDVVGAALIGFPIETLGIKTGTWIYRQDLLQWDWGNIPLFNMPIESMVGYMLLMSFAPTFVRQWREAFGSRDPEETSGHLTEKPGRERKMPALEEKSSADPASSAASLGS